MSERVRIGVIGVGRVGQIAHLEQYAKMPDVELSIADLRPELAAQVAGRFAVSRVYTDHRAMLADGVDAVVVVVRRPATGPVVLDALQAGVHVLSEKPMALTLEDGRRLVDAAAIAGRLYGVAYMKRCDAGVISMRERIRELVIDRSWGDLLDVNAWSHAGVDETPPQSFGMTAEIRPDGLATWLTRPAWLPTVFCDRYEESLNVHSHVTNLVRWLLGQPAVPISAEIHGAEILVQALAGRVRVSFDLRDDRRTSPWREGVAFYFEGGSIRIDLPAPFAQTAASRIVESASNGSQERLIPAGGGAFFRQARAFVDALRGARAFPAPGSDALYDLQFADDLWRHLSAAAKPEYV